MSQVNNYSRSDLYEKYKEKDPQLAKKFLGAKYSSSGLVLIVGACVLGAAILTSIIVLSILGGATNGFGPMPDGNFYPFAFSVIGGICGGCGILGLVMLAIGYCKRRNALAELLSWQEINRIANKIN